MAIEEIDMNDSNANTRSGSGRILPFQGRTQELRPLPAYIGNVLSEPGADFSLLIDASQHGSDDLTTTDCSLQTIHFDVVVLLDALICLLEIEVVSTIGGIMRLQSICTAVILRYAWRSS